MSKQLLVNESLELRPISCVGSPPSTQFVVLAAPLALSLSGRVRIYIMIFGNAQFFKVFLVKEKQFCHEALYIKTVARIRPSSSCPIFWFGLYVKTFLLIYNRYILIITMLSYQNIVSPKSSFVGYFCLISIMAKKLHLHKLWFHQKYCGHY